MKALSVVTSHHLQRTGNVSIDQSLIISDTASARTIATGSTRAQQRMHNQSM